MKAQITLTGEITVRRKEWDDGSVSYYFLPSSKNMKGEWISAIVPLSFKKGTNLADRTVINVTSAWYKVSGSKGKEKFGFFISEYDGAEEVDGWAKAEEGIPF